MSTYTVSEDGDEKITSSEVYMIISLILSMIIYMFIAMFSGMVMQSVIEEKASRVVEVLVSSVKATELMFGKIIGVACVALTQFLLWIVLTAVLVTGFSAFVGFDSLMGDPAQTEQIQVESQEAIVDEDVSKVKGTVDEIKDFMFIVTDDSEVSYAFTFEEKPEGLDKIAVGDKVIVTYTGTISEVDPFMGKILSVEKQS